MANQKESTTLFTIQGLTLPSHTKGTLSNILIEGKQDFHQEKDRILAVGLEVSNYINVDDTGARHNVKNGYPFAHQWR